MPTEARRVGSLRSRGYRPPDERDCWDSYSGHLEELLTAEPSLSRLLEPGFKYLHSLGKMGASGSYRPASPHSHTLLLLSGSFSMPGFCMPGFCMPVLSSPCSCRRMYPVLLVLIKESLATSGIRQCHF